jgi:hypothetical protein
VGYSLVMNASESEPTAADVRARYPQWVPYWGTPEQLCHARRIGSTVTVRGDSWQDVLDEIVAAEARLAEVRGRG